MTPEEKERLTFRETKLRVARILIADVAACCGPKWQERLKYAAEWLAGIEHEMEEYFERKTRC